MLWWNANSGDEKGGFRVDDDVDKVIELSLGVIVAVSCVSIVMRRL
jgi:hypothetical protein